jgi:hypothetical protein
MTIVEVRNTIVKLLEEYLKIPVVLSEQTNPMPPFPLCFYSILTAYVPSGEMGQVDYTLNPDKETITTTRTEQPYAVFSFTFCSENRHDKDGGFILGEDEALALAEKAQGFFLHGAYNILSNLGIVINQVTNVTNRTGLVVDETTRRYGFDVRVRYKRVDSRTDGTVSSVVLLHKTGLRPPAFLPVRSVNIIRKD